MGQEDEDEDCFGRQGPGGLVTPLRMATSSIPALSHRLPSHLLSPTTSTMALRLTSASITHTETHVFRVKQFSTILHWSALNPSADSKRLMVEFNDLPFWVPARNKGLNGTAPGSETSWCLSFTYVASASENGIQVNLTAVPTAAEKRKGGWLRFAIDYFIDVLTVPSTNDPSTKDSHRTVGFEGFQTVFTRSLPSVVQFFSLNEVLPETQNSSPTLTPPEYDLIIRARIVFTNAQISTIQHSPTSPPLSLPDSPPSLSLPPSGSLTFDLSSLLQSYPCHSDLTFTFKDDARTIRAHRAILSSRSTYFSALLSPRWSLPDSPTTTIQIIDVTYEALLAAVYYLYTARFLTSPTSGGPPFTFAQLQDICIAADMYDLPELEFHVNECICANENTNIDLGSWYNLLAFALKCKSILLADRIREFVVERWDVVVESDEMAMLVEEMTREIVQAMRKGRDGLEGAGNKREVVIKEWLADVFRDIAGKERKLGLQYNL